MSDSIVFVIEDNRDSARLNERLIDSVGLPCEKFQTGVAAKKRMQEVVPDLILLDLRLSDVDSGKSIIHMVNNEKRFSKTKIILITAYATEGRKLENLVEQVIIKPINARELQHLIAAHV